MHFLAVGDVEICGKPSFYLDPTDGLTPGRFGAIAKRQARSQSLLNEGAQRASEFCGPFLRRNQQLIGQFNGGFHTASHIAIIMGLSHPSNHSREVLEFQGQAHPADRRRCTTGRRPRLFPVTPPCPQGESMTDGWFAGNP